MRNFMILGCLLVILALTQKVVTQSQDVDEDYDDFDGEQEVPVDFVAVFTSESQDKEVDLGEDITIRCALQQKLPAISMMWKHGQKTIVMSTYVLGNAADKARYSVDESIEGEYNLHIRGIKESDNGTYICEVSTKPSIQQTSVVHVRTPPRIMTMPENKYEVVKKGDPLKLACKATGYPQPTVVWTRDLEGKREMPTGEMSISDPVLLLPLSDRSMGGNYYCTASNGVGEPVSRKFRVDVNHKPEIELEDEIINIDENTQSDITCTVHAEPKPSMVRWYKDGKPVDESEVETSTNKYTISLKNINKKDFGNYSCVAKNEYGSARKSVEVTGLPLPAKFVSDPRGTEKTVYNLKWQVKSHSPLTKYRVSYRKLKANDSTDLPSEWMDLEIEASPVDDGSVQQGSFYIEDLAPETIYEAKVQSKNSYGWSKMSKKYKFSTKGAEYLFPNTEPQSDAEPTAREISGVGNSSNRLHWCNLLVILIFINVMCTVC